MKKVLIISGLISSLSLGLASCESEVTKETQTVYENSNEGPDYSDFKGESLKDKGINALIMLPDETSNTGAVMEPDFQKYDDRYWIVDMGSRFQMVIEDLGDEENALTRIKQQQDDLGVYKIEYIIDEPNLIMYKRMLKYGDNSNLEVQENVTFHCAGTAKIDGINYLIKSGNDDVGFPEMTIKDMVKTIQSFKTLDVEKES